MRQTVSKLGLYFGLSTVIKAVRAVIAKIYSAVLPGREHFWHFPLLAVSSVCLLKYSCLFNLIVFKKPCCTNMSSKVVDSSSRLSVVKTAAESLLHSIWTQFKS